MLPITLFVHSSKASISPSNVPNNHLTASCIRERAAHDSCWSEIAIQHPSICLSVSACRALCPNRRRAQIYLEFAVRSVGARSPRGPSLGAWEWNAAQQQQPATDNLPVSISTQPTHVRTHTIVYAVMYSTPQTISNSVQKRNGTKTDLNAARNVINKNNYVLLTAAAAGCCIVVAWGLSTSARIPFCISLKLMLMLEKEPAQMNVNLRVVAFYLAQVSWMKVVRW